MAPILHRRPLEELSPNKSSISSFNTPLKVSKTSLYQNSLNSRALSFDDMLSRDMFSNVPNRKLNPMSRSWTTDVSSSPPRKSGYELRLSSPMPLLPRSESSTVVPVKAESCRKHADRLKVRLRLALYKVATNQEELSFSQIPEPDNVSIQSIAKYSNGPSHNNRESPVLENMGDAIRGLSNEKTASAANGLSNKNEIVTNNDHGFEFSINDNNNNNNTTTTSHANVSSAKSFVTPSRRLLALPRASASVNPNGSAFSSSPVKNPLLGSAVKGTPASMGAARSLLKLGAF